MDAPRPGDRVRVLWPPPHAGRLGVVEVPLWTTGEGRRCVGVRLDGAGEMAWAEAVEFLRRAEWRG
jgi:hypothetical protein